MMARDLIELLRNRDIRPSAQRVAVAEYVLNTTDHPTAEQVLSHVRRTMPTLSRATTYNTLNLFVRKGLLRQLDLTEGCVIFDPNLGRHHHFIDDETKRIYDIPWSALDVDKVEDLDEFEIDSYQVVLRGRRRSQHTLFNQRPKIADLTADTE